MSLPTVDSQGLLSGEVWSSLIEEAHEHLVPYTLARVYLQCSPGTLVNVSPLIAPRAGLLRLADTAVSYLFSSLFDLKFHNGLNWVKAYYVGYVGSFSARFCVFCYLLTTVVDHYLFAVFYSAILCRFFLSMGS